ncbi:MAG: imidazolonepropionase [Rhodothermales bacterium]|nr:imidazolonepropionase [Rhodothermales bacterium]
MLLFNEISELYTPVDRIPNAAMVVEDGRFVWVGPTAELPDAYLDDVTLVSLRNRAVLPGLVDSHTHLVWAGLRVDEYLRRARGETYEAILEAGGGIHNTVRATAAASEDELLAGALDRARYMLAQGVTTLEIKSGYGLEPEQELKMLRVIRRLAAETPQHIVPTLLAHVIPAGWDRRAYVEMFCRDLIPEVAREGLATAVDVFCDRGAFTLEETRRLFEAAAAHGLAYKVHAEQLTHTGATRLAAEMGALSADHLEQTTPADWQALAASSTVATLLPGATVVLRKHLPDVRGMLDVGVKIAIATDHNPGSSPFYSLPLCLQLGMALGGMSAEEALLAGTAHAADALGLSDRGRLATGSAADFLVVDSPHALALLYPWGGPAAAEVYVGGVAINDL